MSDDTQKGDGEAAAGPVAGERLAEARRLKQISLPDVARQLHLDEPRVQALEENRFDVLGAPVFAKGYLRKYAKLVGVSIDDVMSDYYTLNRATGAPPVVGPPRRRSRDIDPMPWIIGLIVVLLLAGVAFWWLQREPGEPQAAGLREQVQSTQLERRAAPQREADADEGQAEAESPPPSEGTSPAVSPASAPEPAASETGAAANDAPVRETAARVIQRPSATRGDIELRLAYSGDCWTEVTDADGRRLFFDLGTAGRTVTVEGAPPIRVLVGNEENVRLTVDGRPYTIASANRRGNTARFTVNRP